jgi:hypothetical protein
LENLLESRIGSEVLESRVESPRLEWNEPILDPLIEKAKAIIEIAEFGVQLGDAQFSSRDRRWRFRLSK